MALPCVSGSSSVSISFQLAFPVTFIIKTLARNSETKSTFPSILYLNDYGLAIFELDMTLIKEIRYKVYYPFDDSFTNVYLS